VAGPCFYSKAKADRQLHTCQRYCSHPHHDRYIEQVAIGSVLHVVETDPEAEVLILEMILPVGKGGSLRETSGMEVP